MIVAVLGLVYFLFLYMWALRQYNLNCTLLRKKRGGNVHYLKSSYPQRPICEADGTIGAISRSTQIGCLLSRWWGRPQERDLSPIRRCPLSRRPRTARHGFYLQDLGCVLWYVGSWVICHKGAWKFITVGVAEFMVMR